ncbi:MAG: fumarylacetoacetate hydrolase family protein, partial [Candidatus Hodarchaeota archaeon]
QNGILRQNSNTKYMLFTLDILLNYISRFITLEPGDLVFTGTPEGVGSILDGDTLVGNIDSFPPLEISVKELKSL